MVLISTAADRVRFCISRSSRQAERGKAGDEMELDQAIHARRAVREYTTEPVDEATLRRLIAAATLAPSAMNEQPWLFTVVRDKALLARISAGGKAATLAAASGGQRRHLEKFENPAFDILYHAPVLIVISSATKGSCAVENCALAAQNLMLAARGEGLGTCWIGLAQGWIGTAEGKAALGLPPDCLPVAPIIVGHTAAFPPPVPRKAPQISWIG
jgi:nitroreductase